jgi:hypothetical protein
VESGGRNGKRLKKSAPETLSNSPRLKPGLRVPASNHLLIRSPNPCSVLRRWNFAGTEFPENLTEDPEGELGIGGGEVQATDEAADFLFGGGGGPLFLGVARARFQVAAGPEGFEQERSEAFELGGGRGEVFLRFRNGLRNARQLVQADGYRLAKVHGAMLFARGNAQQPVAVAEIFIRKTALFGTEKKGDSAGRKAFEDEGRGFFEAPDGVLQLTGAHGRGSDDQRAILHSFGDGLELFGLGEQRLGADGGTRLPKCQLVRVHHTKMEKAKVAHGACGSADIEGIARVDEDDAQAVGFGAE